MDKFCPYCNIGLDYQQIKNRMCNNCSCELKEEKEWGIFYDRRIKNLIHIYPLDEKHSQEIISGSLPPPISDCECHPKVKWNEDKETWIMIHGAFNGREAIEETNSILNINNDRRTV